MDGDGCLSLYEMEQFYSATLDKMQSLGIEGLPVEDCLCQVGRDSGYTHTYTLTHKHSSTLQVHESTFPVPT